MILIILGIIFVIALIYIFFRTKQRAILKYDTICKICGNKKGIFKCTKCKF